jgi:hypothetical protein
MDLRVVKNEYIKTGDVAGTLDQLLVFMKDWPNENPDKFSVENLRLRYSLSDQGLVKIPLVLLAEELLQLLNHLILNNK